MVTVNDICDHDLKKETYQISKCLMKRDAHVGIK